MSEDNQIILQEPTEQHRLSMMETTKQNKEKKFVYDKDSFSPRKQKSYFTNRMLMLRDMSFVK